MHRLEPGLRIDLPARFVSEAGHQREIPYTVIMKIKADDRSGELLALCCRQQWERARQLIQQGRAAETVKFVLTDVAATESFDVNGALHHDGKTLLHYAMEKKHLRIIRSLLDAGALVTLPDRKGLRACDAATWTEVLQPALMQPLQQVVQLQQTNLRLEEHTHLLISLAQSLRHRREHVQSRTNVLQTDVDVSTAFRKDVLRQVEGTKDIVQRLDDDKIAATARLARTRRDILGLQSQRDGAQHDVDVCNAETGRIVDTRDRLVQQTHAHQCARLDALATRFVLKCEVVRMAMRFEKNESLQAQSLRSLLQMCRKPATREKLVINGLQRLVLEIMQRFPKNESIYLDGCALILLLTQEADAANKEVLNEPTSEGDAAGARTTIGAWQTRQLVEFLTTTTLEFAHALTYEAICEKTHEVLQCLRHSRHCNDVEDASELDEIMRQAHILLVQHASFSSLTCAALQHQLQNATKQG